MSDGQSSSAAGFGIVGSMVAVVMSWEANHSVLWAAVHACLGWAYVIYRMCASACGE